MKTSIKRAVILVMLAGFNASALAPSPSLASGATVDPMVTERFQYLSTHGNSSCSPEFSDSIATMPVIARLQGSCCSPMEAHRYSEQLEGLKEYAAYSEIPSDPYDIPVGLAQKFMPEYAIDLSPAEQQAYAYAMQHSNEGGPCCCTCWRWEFYGGLAKHLIRDRNFIGEQITEIWDLSDGCGGAGDHLHG
jgi:hypothetical protein